MAQALGTETDPLLKTTPPSPPFLPRGETGTPMEKKRTDDYVPLIDDEPVLHVEVNLQGLPRNLKRFLEAKLEEARHAFDFSQLPKRSKIKFIVKIGSSIVASVLIGIPTYFLYGTTGKKAADYITVQLNSTIPAVFTEVTDEAAGILMNIMLNALGTVLAMFAFIHFAGTTACYGDKNEYELTTDRTKSLARRIGKVAWESSSTIWLTLFPSIVQGYLMILEKAPGTPVDDYLLFMTMLNITTNIPQMILAVSDIHAPTHTAHWDIMLKYLDAQINMWANLFCDKRSAAMVLRSQMYERLDAINATRPLTQADLLYAFLTLHVQSEPENNIIRLQFQGNSQLTPVGEFLQSTLGSYITASIRGMGTAGALGFTMITASAAVKIGSSIFDTENPYGLSALYATAFISTWIAYRLLYGKSISSVLNSVSSNQETPASMTPWTAWMIPIGALTLAGFVLFPFSGATGGLVSMQSFYTALAFLAGTDSSPVNIYARIGAIAFGFASLATTPLINIKFYNDMMGLMRAYLAQHFFFITKDQELQIALGFIEALQENRALLNNVPEANQTILLQDVFTPKEQREFHPLAKLLIGLYIETLNPDQKKALRESKVFKEENYFKTLTQDGLETEIKYEDRDKKSRCCWGGPVAMFKKARSNISDYFWPNSRESLGVAHDGPSAPNAQAAGYGSLNV